MTSNLKRTLVAYDKAVNNSKKVAKISWSKAVILEDKFLSLKISTL